MDNNICYNKQIGENCVYVTSHTTLSYYKGNIVIPSTVVYNGVEYPVKRIGDGAFKGCTELLTVEIPEGMTSIGASAFEGCTRLRYVNIPSTITYLGAYSFRNCSSLEETEGIGNSNITMVNHYAFAECVNLKTIDLPFRVKEVGASAYANASRNHSSSINSGFKVTIPSTLEIIGQEAFSGVGITSLYIPANIRNIGKGAFSTYYCNTISVDPNNPVYDSRNTCQAVIDTWSQNLLLGCKSSYIPDGVKTISSYAFSNCSGLRYVTIPESVREIEESAFFNCSNLTSVEIKSPITVINSGCFYQCPISELKMPSTITRINSDALYYYISDFVVPEGVTYIETRGLNSKMMTKANSITFPSTLKYLGSCSVNYPQQVGLSEVRCLGDVPGYTAQDAFVNVDFATTVLYVREQYKKKYATTSPWSEFEIIESVKEVERINLSQSEIKLTVGERCHMNAAAVPSDATITQLSWTSSDNGVVNVDNGSLQAMGEGEAFITVAAIDGSGVAATCKVTVTGYVNKVSEIELVDGRVYSSDIYRQASTLTYSRNFGSTKWQALYIPFSMSYDDWKNDFSVARINAIRMYDTDEDGEIDVTEIEVIKINNGTLYPNHPYLIQAKEVGPHVITLHDAVVYPSRIGEVKCATAETNYTFRGTYEGVSGADMVAHKYYALSNGAFCYTTNTNASLGAGRWYLDIEDKGPQVISPIRSASVRIRCLSMDGEEDEVIEQDDASLANGVEDLEIASDAHDSNIRTLDGRIVKPESSGLRPGIYIIDNKKVLVR